MPTPRPLQLDRRDLIWLACGGLITAAFAMVAYDQLYNLHFSAWRLYPNQPTTEPLAEALRGPVTGWYRPFVVAAAGLAGLLATARVMTGRWQLLAGLLVGLLAVIVGIEFTQGSGQDTTPTSQVDHVAASSVVLAALVGATPLVVAVLSVRGIWWSSRREERAVAS